MAVAVQLRLSRDLYTTKLSLIRPSNQQGVMASCLAYSPDVSGTSDVPQASQELCDISPGDELSMCPIIGSRARLTAYRE